MAHNNSQWVTHIVDGGWATDFGNTLYASPNEGELRLPWLNTCENIKFYLDKSFGKYPGLFEITSSPIIAPPSSNGLVASSFVRTLYDYVKLGASLTGTRTRVAVVGGWLYDVSLIGNASLIGDVNSLAERPVHLTTFNDLLIIGGGSQPKSWDGTTFQALAGTPQVFSFSTSHAGRHWAAGVSSNPSRLYYSAVGNPEDWVGAGSGSIDIDPGDGDGIVALLSWKRELWVFKGPNRLSIHRITGTSTSDFSRTAFIYGVSAAGQSAIFPVGNDFAFWSPRGSCHTINATADYGDYAQAYSNYPVLSWFRNYNNITGGDSSNAWQTMTDLSQNVSYCLFNNNPSYGNSENYNPELVLMDWKFASQDNPYPRFIRIKLHKFSSLAMTASEFNPAQLMPSFGTDDGRIMQERLSEIALYVDGNENAFPYTIETPSLTYGPSCYAKAVTSVSVDVVSNYNVLNATVGTLEFSYGGRKAPAQTLTFSNRGDVPLGTFVLGTDQLGTNGSINNFTEDVNGESTAFAYTLREDSPLSGFSGQDVRVRHFGVLINSSGESLEN